MSWIQPGTIVKSPRLFHYHYGIAGDRLIDGFQSILYACAKEGGVVEASAEQFAKGRGIEAGSYPSSTSPNSVLSNSRALVGRQYRLFSSNCEHFVREAHGLKPASPQVSKLVLTLAILGIAFTICKTARA